MLELATEGIVTILQHPLWPELLPYMLPQQKGDDGKTRLEVLAMPDALTRMAVLLEVKCPACGLPMHPIRARAEAQRGEHLAQNLYYAAACSLRDDVACSRSAAAHDEYLRVVDAVRGKKLDDEFSSASAEHYTPRWIIELAREVMGGIDCDPATCLEAQEWIKAKVFYTLKTNGLLPRWFGRIWINPPGDKQSKLAKAFWKHLWSQPDTINEFHWLAFNISQLRVLQPEVENCWIAVPNQRIRFSGTSPTRDNAIIYYGPNSDKFIRAWERHGAVWEPTIR